MEFRTVVDIPQPDFRIEPCEEMLFVGSCFADSIGRRFVENKFRATVNPYGTMYNPASVLHALERWLPLRAEAGGELPRVVFLTLGTNHVYRLRETGEIVDNCQKRPAALFQEEQLSVDECADYLRQCVDLLRRYRPDVQVVLTVSPIRYRKYGYHGSQLSKATLLLAIDHLLHSFTSSSSHLSYFPAYELLMDELRDYRFYADDMLHPSSQAVAYIWQRLTETCLSDAARQFLREWAPLKAALGHRPYNPDSADYQAFKQQTGERLAALASKYPGFQVE
ncbi:MAG: GSCFA domain-containing protein [Prevotella sp.]|nr:GSCFA domain-containing protein [Prevotella sp.]